MFKQKFKHKQKKKTCTKRIERIDSIRAFLENDENSSMSPGKKDTIRTKCKKFLNDTLSNLYDKYCPENNLQLCRATFYRLRPFRIIQKIVSARDTCKCKTHTNMEYLIKKLVYLKLIKVQNVREFIKLHTCDNNNENFSKFLQRLHNVQ